MEIFKTETRLEQVYNLLSIHALKADFAPLRNFATRQAIVLQSYPKPQKTGRAL